MAAIYAKLDFAAATLAETLRQVQKREVELEWEAPTLEEVGAQSL